MSTISSLIVIALLALIVKLCKDSFAKHAKRAPYPPGPKPKPIIGNMFDFPVKDAPQEYVEWGKKYNSPLLYASSLGNDVIIINSREVADELFERRARIYSDRPTIPLADMLGYGYNVALLKYGDEWRTHRKVLQQNFGPLPSRGHHQVQLQKVHQMLRALLEKPEDFDDHNKMLSISIPMATAYGYDVESIDDPCVVAADMSITLGARLMLPGESLVNLIPALKHIPSWFPGASSHKRAAEVWNLTEDMKRLPLEFVRKQLDDGLAAPSLVSSFLERKYSGATSEEEERAVYNIAPTIYGAASDTTISASRTFFYMMVLNPAVQKKAQAEIDRVVGPHRLPNFEDRDSLPYIEAIYREVLRMRPPAPLAVPHRLTEDDYYQGYYLPKGASVFGNIWAMTHDEEAYPDPFAFKPERFIDEQGNLNDDDRILAYGFGRRVCAGKHVASSTMWLLIVSVLACFGIEKHKDADGHETEIEDDYEDLGVLSHKKKFKCSFKVRSSLAEKLISDASDSS